MMRNNDRYRLVAMDKGNDQWSLLDTTTQQYWSREGWQRPDSGWASVLSRSEAAQIADDLNRNLHGNVSNYIEPPHQVQYVIRSLGESDVDLDGDVGAFWSNEDGWGSLQSATLFSTKERMSLNLPMSAKLDAEWMLAEEARDLDANRNPQGNVAKYTDGLNHEPSEHEMAAEYIELELTMRSKTTFGTDKETIRVWDGQSAKDVAERTAQGYGAEVVEIRNPDGSIYEEAMKVEDSPSPGM